MSQFARVDSVEALKEFRVSLCKFAAAVRGGLDEAEAEIHRTAIWLKHDQHSYWKVEVGKRAELVIQAKIALERKKVEKTPLGGRSSCVEERKALATAQRRLEEAEKKVANVRRWAQELEREALSYRGQVQVMSRTLEADVPRAVAQLDNMIGALESYMSATGPGGERTPAEALASDEAGPTGRAETNPPPEARHDPPP